MEDNNMSLLPQNFNEIEHLVHLNLSKNYFTAIPSVLSQLNELKYCSFKCNLISVLNEDVLTTMVQVYKIDLEDNPLINLDKLPVRKIKQK